MAGRGSDREQRRRAILQAARLVFARKGFEPSTLEEVAREAGLAKGTLYLYFKDKEDLYFQTMVDLLERALAEIGARAEAPGDALGRLRGIAMGQLSFIARHRDTMHLLAPFSNPTLARLHKRLIAALMERLTAHRQRVIALVEEGQRAGSVRRDLEARHIALAFIGMTNQLSQTQMRPGPRAPAVQPLEEQSSPEQMVEVMMRILLEGVMRR
jgi:TetR/AcrR family fatty acid metabolism transcriptional regulator